MSNRVKTRKRKGKRQRNIIPRTVTPDVVTWRDAIVAPQENVRLVFTSIGAISGAGPSLMKRYNSNSAYRPEVSGSTGNTPGFAFWSGAYEAYRVIRYKYEITLCNNEAFPVVVYIMNANIDPGTATTALTASGNPLSQVHTLSAKGGQDRFVFRKTLSIARVVGSDIVESDDAYAAPISSSPSDVTWIGLGGQSTTGGNLTNGFAFQVTLTQFVRFYNRFNQ